MEEYEIIVKGKHNLHSSVKNVKELNRTIRLIRAIVKFT